MDSRSVITCDVDGHRMVCTVKDSLLPPACHDNPPQWVATEEGTSWVRNYLEVGLGGHWKISKLSRICITPANDNPYVV